MTDTSTKRQRQKARSAARRDLERQVAARNAIVRRGAIIVGALAVVATLFGLAVLLTADPVPDDSVAPEITGDPLPALTAGAEDPAVGADAPDVTGSNYSGEQVTIGGQGAPQAIVFLAHWCPHCQREVPAVIDWVEQGNLPDGVELVAVSTLSDPTRGNWPPQEWLARENWPGLVLVDPEDVVAEAYGLEGTPYWVFLDADGQVVSRASGELPTEELARRMDAIAGG